MQQLDRRPSFAARGEATEVGPVARQDSAAVRNLDRSLSLDVLKQGVRMARDANTKGEMWNDCLWSEQSKLHDDGREINIERARRKNGGAYSSFYDRP